MELQKGKKLFVMGGIASITILLLYLAFNCWQQSDEIAQAITEKKPVIVKVQESKKYEVGNTYSVSWNSDCKGGNVAVWFSAVGDEKAQIGILVPLMKFNTTDFGETDKDARVFLTNPFKFNLSATENKNKLKWKVPSVLSQKSTAFGGKKGVLYIYTVSDGSYALHKIVEDPIEMSVMPDKYYIRVDISGKNGCQATGYSTALNIVNK